MEKNYYEILGVSRNATLIEIKKRYRYLAGMHHPDKQGGDKLIFSKISMAFDTLKNDNKRKSYDNNLNYNERIEREKREREEYEKKARNEQLKRERDLENKKNKENNTLKYNTNFEIVHIKEKNLKKEKPLYIIQNLTLKESERGTIKKIEYERVITCDLCNGVGKGMYDNVQVECPKCFGTGQKLKKEIVKLEIPPNTIVGRTITLNNLGNETKDINGRNGDLIIQIGWKGKWNSKNNDIFTEVKIGKKDIENKFFNFKNFDGKHIKVFIPENIQDGQIIKLKQKGWDNFKSDLYITIYINKSFTQKIKEIFL